MEPGGGGVEADRWAEWMLAAPGKLAWRMVPKWSCALEKPKHPR